MSLMRTSSTTLLPYPCVDSVPTGQRVNIDRAPCRVAAPHPRLPLRRHHPRAYLTVPPSLPCLFQCGQLPHRRPNTRSPLIRHLTPLHPSRNRTCSSRMTTSQMTSLNVIDAHPPLKLPHRRVAPSFASPTLPVAAKAKASGALAWTLRRLALSCHALRSQSNLLSLCLIPLTRK
jgi:hypothetical protein